jgi:CBS domain-containing protein
VVFVAAAIELVLGVPAAVSDGPGTALVFAAIALSLGAAFGAGAAVACAVVGALWRAGRRGAGAPVSRRRARLAIGGSIALAWVGILAAVLVDAPILHVFPFVVDGAFTLRLVGVVTVAALVTTFGLPYLARFAERRPRGVIGAGAALAVLTVATIGWLGGDASARRIALASPTLDTFARVVMAVADFDADGYSHVLGGGDCDPLDGDVHPDARDAPNDGIDQNCNGADYTPGPRPSPLPDAPVPPALRRHDLDVLLITIDTLRYDRLGFAGHTRDTSPALDALAARGAWFERAYSTSYRTWFAMPSLVTSQYPPELGLPSEPVGAGRPAPLPEHAVTLAEVLDAAGYHTGMFTSFFYFDRWRLDQGIDEFANAPRDGDGERTAAALVTDRAIEHVDHTRGAGGRWFAWVHYFEPHLPYDEREVDFGDGDEARYDSEIRHVDGQIARLLEHVDLDRTIVVVTSDHGEGLGERGVHGHTAGLHDFLLHVPLIVAVPGAAPRRVATVASIIDIAPTIAAFAGVAPDPSWTGRAHVAAVAHGRDDPDHIVFAADPIRHRYVAIARAARLVHDQYNDLYTLTGDEAERERLRTALVQWRDRILGD